MICCSNFEVKVGRHTIERYRCGFRGFLSRLDWEDLFTQLRQAGPGFMRSAKRVRHPPAVRVARDNHCYSFVCRGVIGGPLANALNQALREMLERCEAGPVMKERMGKAKALKEAMAAL
jgi:hypothetical protein